MRKIKFISEVTRWFDKVNGNTYHSVKVTRIKDNKIIVFPFTYGYGSAYEQTTEQLLFNTKWLPKKYNKENVYLYNRENNYPIKYIVNEGTKKQCIANGIL